MSLTGLIAITGVVLPDLPRKACERSTRETRRGSAGLAWGSGGAKVCLAAKVAGKSCHVEIGESLWRSSRAAPTALTSRESLQCLHEAAALQCLHEAAAAAAAIITISLVVAHRQVVGMVLSHARSARKAGATSSRRPLRRDQRPRTTTSSRPRRQLSRAERASRSRPDWLARRPTPARRPCSPRKARRASNSTSMEKSRCR